MENLLIASLLDSLIQIETASRKDWELKAYTENLIEIQQQEEIMGLINNEKCHSGTRAQILTASSQEMKRKGNVMNVRQMSDTCFTDEFKSTDSQLVGK